nr:MAG TPA: hypothetical protein [Caudoviricetes sp.]
MHWILVAIPLFEIAAICVAYHISFIKQCV